MGGPRLDAGGICISNMHGGTAMGQGLEGSTSHADFGAATHPGVGGGTHRRRATFERC